MNALLVVADAGHARLFRARESWKDVKEQEDLIHAGSRRRDRELVSDSAGRTSDQHSTLNARTSAKEHEERYFAKQLARHLKRLYNKDTFEELILVAAPRFLGMLRSELQAPLDKLESRTIQKELVHMESGELIEYIRNYW